MKIKCSLQLNNIEPDELNYKGKIIINKANYMIDTQRIIHPYIKFTPPIAFKSKITSNIVILNTLILNDFNSAHEWFYDKDSLNIDNYIFSVGDELYLTIENGNAFIEFNAEFLQSTITDNNKFIYLLPEDCPFCSYSLSWGEKVISKKVRLYVPSCENISCPAFLYSNIHAFLNAISFDDEYYRSIIDKLILENIFKSPLDIFKLTAETIKNSNLSYLFKNNTSEVIDKFIEYIEYKRTNLTLYQILKGIFYMTLEDKDLEVIVNEFKTFNNLFTFLNDMCEGNLEDDPTEWYSQYLVDILINKFILPEEGFVRSEFKILIT